MKVKSLKFLPVLAFLVAIGAAFVTQGAERPVANILKKYVNGSWQVIPDGENHICRDATTNCTAEFTPQGAMVQGTLELGRYEVQQP